MWRISTISYGKLQALPWLRGKEESDTALPKPALGLTVLLSNALFGASSHGRDTGMTEPHWVILNHCLVLNMGLNWGKMSVGALKTSPSAPVEWLLGRVEVGTAAAQVSIASPLTFHVDLPRVGRRQPFPVVSLAAEQRRLIHTCADRNKGPAQNALIAPVLTENPCSLAVVSLHAKENLMLCSSLPSTAFVPRDGLHHPTRPPSTPRGPNVPTVPLHNLLSKCLLRLGKGKGGKQKSPPAPPRWLGSDDLLLSEDCSNLPAESGGPAAFGGRWKYPHVDGCLPSLGCRHGQAFARTSSTRRVQMTRSSVCQRMQEHPRGMSHSFRLSLPFKACLWTPR